jgi:hypothetical protein
VLAEIMQTIRKYGPDATRGQCRSHRAWSGAELRDLAGIINMIEERLGPDALRAWQ